MGVADAFLNVERQENKSRSVKERINDLYGNIPVQVQNLFEQKELDLFVNIDGVSSLEEKDKYYVIKMSEEWTNHCDGVKFFEKMNEISNKINLRLVNRKIEIQIPNRQKSMLHKVIKSIEE